MNRKFYPMKRKSAYSKGKGRGASTSSASGNRDFKGIKCLRCGGSHQTQNCPQKDSTANNAEETAEIAFVAHVESPEQQNSETVKMLEKQNTESLEMPEKQNTESIEMPEKQNTEFSEASGVQSTKLSQLNDTGVEISLSADTALTCHEDAISAGYGIVDCGATASLVSVDAMEAIMRANMDSCGQDRVTLLPEVRPVFRFGNGEKKTCISTVQLQINMDDRVGNMQLHVHDTPGQPALISVKALRNLGAVIDFSTNDCVFTKVNPHAVVRLKTADNGHILMPLAHNMFANAPRRRTPFLGLTAE